MLKKRVITFFLDSKIKLVITQGLNAFFGLLIGKLIALYFSPEDFGEFTLQFALYTLLFSLLISPFLQFIKATTKTLVLKVGHKYYIYLICVLMLTLYLLLLSTFRFKYLTLGLLVLIIPFNVFYSLISDYFNVNSFINLFSLNSLFKSLLPLTFLGILFFVNYNYSDGTVVLWGSQFFGFLCSLFFIKHYKILNSRYKISFVNFIKRYFSYAWPLVILAFWAWINNYFDRYAIDYYLTTKDVGIYNANYALGAKFFLLLNPIFLTLLVPNVYGNNSVLLKKTSISKYVKKYILVSLPILVLIYFSSDFIGSILLSESYSSGFYLIFWIALAYFFLTTVFLYETIFYANGSTKVILYSNIVAAILNIILNVILIPLYGLTGAFISTLISFISRFIILIYYGKL